jgi:hypothetical protein
MVNWFPPAQQGGMAASTEQDLGMAVWLGDRIHLRSLRVE